MNKRTLAALEGSIEKWRKIAYAGGADEGKDNCPLCKLFWHHDCDGCPVSAATGAILCWDSPYARWCNSCGPTRQGEWGHVANTSQQKRLAIAELKFLRSLRPKKKTVRRSSKR